MYLKIHTQKNKKDGHERRYVQIVESRRVNGQPRQKVLLSLGRIDTPEGRKRLESLTEAFIEASERHDLLNIADDLKALCTKEYGPFLIFKRIWDELKLGDLILSELDHSQVEFDIPNAIFNMVLNRLSCPSSKRRLESWQKNIEGPEHFKLHQYYRALDYLIENKDSLEKSIFNRMRDLFDPGVDIVLFDTTTLAYYGDSDQHEELLDYGFSKIRRSDLKQIVIGVIMSKNGIPLGHEVFKGSRNDVSCFAEIIDQISSKYKLNRVVMVGDRGMISKKNIKLLEESGYQYILGYRMRTIPQEKRAGIFNQENFQKLRHSELKYKEAVYEGNRLIICHNEERAQKDKLHREHILEKLRKKVGSGELASIIDNPHYKRFLRIRGEKPVIDMEKVERDEMYDGMFILTSNANLNAMDTVEAYKDLWQVELAFRQLKSELEMGPVWHWKDRRIRAHIMICFLAFALRTVFYKKLRKKDPKISYTDVMDDIRALKACELDVKTRKVRIRTELQPGAVIAFQAIGMRPPNRILYLGDGKNVVVRD